MAKIIKIHIEGFGSVLGKIKYKFDRPGISLILGKNGAGKTTIFNALSWCLYGKLLKPDSTVLPWGHIIPESFRGCRVEVELDGGTRIIRCNDFRDKVAGKKGGNRLVIIRDDGKEDRTLRNKSDVQKSIDGLVGYSFQLFKSTVLFAQELPSLIDDDGPTRKRTFDEAFESAFIQRAKDIAETTLKTLEDEYKDLNSTRNAKSEMFESNKKILESLREEHRRFGLQKARKIKDLRSEIRTIKGNIATIQKGKNISIEKRNLKALIKDLSSKRAAFNAKIDPTVESLIYHWKEKLENAREGREDCEKALKSLSSEKPICIHCDTPLKGKKLEAYRKNISGQRQRLKKALKDKKGIIRLATKSLERLENDAQEQLSRKSNLMEMDERLGEYQIKLESLKKQHFRIKVMQEKIRGIKREINQVRKTKNQINTKDIEAQIEELTKTIGELDKRIKSREKKVEVQRWLIKDPLSNSGLKAFIFNSMLKKVNFYLKSYTQYTGFQITVGMDLESSNKDFYISILRHGAEVSYKDLSRGQKQLVKVVLCFAMDDVNRIGRPINITLMDELFESLDPENIEIVGSIIMNKAKDRSIHIITHKSRFNPPQAYKTFIILKDEKQTVIEQKYRDA